MACPFSNELLLEIASYLDFLELVRDATLASSEPLRSRHNTILNACLVSKRFYTIFHPLLLPFAFDNGDMHRRSGLIKQYLEFPTEASKIRMLSSIPPALCSDNLLLGLDEYTPYFNHVTMYKLPHSIRAFGTLVSLLPNLEALQITVQGFLNVDHHGLLQLLKLVREDQRLVPRLRTITIFCAAQGSHYLDQNGIKDILLLPSLEELNAQGFSNVLRSGWQARARLPELLEERSSNVKILRLFSYDGGSLFLGKLVRSLKRLEDFTLQWAEISRFEGDLYIEHIVNILRAHRTTLKRVAIDGRRAEYLKSPNARVMPLGSFEVFENLAYLSLPAVLVTGKPMAKPGDWYPDDQIEEEFEGALEDWCLYQHKMSGVPIEEVWFSGVDWDLLTTVIPTSLTTLILQSPRQVEDVPRVAEWLQHFAMTCLHRLPALRCVNVSDWEAELLDDMLDFCSFEMLGVMFEAAGKVLKFPVEYLDILELKSSHKTEHVDTHAREMADRVEVSARDILDELFDESVSQADKKR